MEENNIEYEIRYCKKLGESLYCENLVMETEHLSIAVNCFNPKKVKPYFKVRKYSSDGKKVLGLCRIYLYTAKYVTGYDENMELTKEEIFELMSLLVSERYSLKGITNNWSYLIEAINDVVINDTDYKMKSIVPWTPIPNYILLLKGDC